MTASLVVSADGEHVGLDGTSKSLGGQADFEWFIGLRNRAEVILTSGKTFRDEGYKQPKQSRLAVFTRNEQGNSLFDDTLLITPKNASNYTEALQYLLGQGHSRIHCEFGPTGFLELSRTGLVECYLSSEKVTGIENFSRRHGASFRIVAVGDLVIALVGSVAVP